MNLKQQLLSGSAIKVIPNPVEGWEGSYLRSLKGYERGHLLSKVAELEKKGKAIEAEIWIALMCVSHQNGERVFSDDEYGQLAEIDGDVIHQLATVAAQHSGLTGNDDAKKN